ncbi:hypothetical protein ABAC402_17245 [Asticcacaulis sp. AC402]|nr:hypothetical protein ABAC402_17245 [Asticcacaulis sp. AC402]
MKKDILPKRTPPSRRVSPQRGGSLARHLPMEDMGRRSSLKSYRLLLPIQGGMWFEGLKIPIQYQAS